MVGEVEARAQLAVAAVGNAEVAADVEALQLALGNAGLVDEDGEGLAQKLGAGGEEEGAVGSGEGADGPEVLGVQVREVAEDEVAAQLRPVGAEVPG